MGKKQESEFSKTLEELEEKVQILNEQKKIRSRRLVKIQDYLEEKEKAKKKSLEIETDIARKGAIKDRLGIYLSIAAAVTIFIVPYYKNDPVDFWFSVIVILCYGGIYWVKKFGK